MSKTKKWIAAGLSVAMCACGAVGLKTVLASAEEETGAPAAPVMETYKLGDFPYHTGYSKNEDNGWYNGKTNAKYKMMAGVFDKDAANYGLTAFDTWNKDSGGNGNIITCTGKSGLEIQNWKWTFVAQTSVVIVVEAKMNGEISVNFDACSLAGNWDAWNTIYTVNRYNNAEGTLTPLVNYFHEYDSVNDYRKMEDAKASATYNLDNVEMKTGDVLYYEIGNSNATDSRNLQNAQNATITFTPTTAEETPVEKYGKQLDAFVAGLTKTNYTDETWNTIEGYVTAFKGGEYADDAAAKTAFDQAKANIQAVAPDSVSYFVGYYGAKLDTLKGMLHSEDYLADTWTAIGELVTTFKTGSYTDKAAVETAYDTAVTGIRAKETDAEKVSQSYTFGDLPKQTGVSEFGFYERNNVRYKLMAGLFDESADGYGLKSFDTWDGGNKLTLSTVPVLSAENWKWAFAPSTSVVLVIEAKTDGMIEFKMSDVASIAGFNDQNDAVFNVYRYNASSQTLDTLVNFVQGTDTVSGKVCTTEDFQSHPATYDCKVLVKENDIVYYEIGSRYTEGNARNIQNHQAAHIIATPLTSDSAKDFYGEMLDEYVAGLTKENYDDTTWEEIEAIVTEFKAGTYETVDAALTAYNEAKDSIDAVNPDSLSYVRADLLQKIEAYRNSLKEENYEAEGWTTILEAYNTYQREQESKTDKAALQAFYDEQLAAMKAVKVVKQEVVYLDYPTIMGANGFKWIEGDVVDTKLFTGTVKDGLVEFDTIAKIVNKDGKYIDAMYNSELFAEDPTCYVENWRWFVGVGKGVIVAYRAKVDCAITVTDTRVTGGSGNNGWTEQTVLNLYIVRNGVAKLVNTVNKPTTDADFSGTYYAKAGDIIYIEFTTTIADSARNTQSPYATKAVADAKGFDEDLYTDQNHDLPIEVQNLIAEKKAALEAYYAGLNEDDYSATNWTMFEDYINQFAEKCGLGLAAPEVKDENGVNELYNSILASMKAVLTLEQQEAELKATLEGYVKELQAEYDKLVSENKYSSENKAKLDKALEDGIAKVRAAGSKALGNREKSAALTAMRAVEKKGKGCKGSVAGTGIGLAVTLALAGTVVSAVCVSRKKKND